MTSESKLGVYLNANGKFEVLLLGGGKITCENRGDGDAVLDAARRFYEGNSGRKLLRRTLAALERSGMNAANSMLYRSAMRHVAG